MMVLLSYVSLTVFASFVSGYLVPACTESFLSITASATNYDLSGGAFNPNATTPVSGTYNIRVRYCKPTVPIYSRRNTLQLLLHGLTYNEYYWDIAYRPDTYSYARFAAAHGYATLNLARLGYGSSSRPDPITVVQDPLDTAVVTKIIQLARSGKIPGSSGCRFSKVIAAGHSYGSVILNGVMTATPTLVNAYILSGYAHQIGTSVPEIIAGMAPARNVNPARFGGLAPGYVTSINSTTRASSFYSRVGTYDPGALAYDEVHKDTAAQGELLTFPATILPAPAFRGDVLTINGDHDKLFCTTSACAIGPSGKDYYPSANSNQYIVIPNTGHCINFHYTAPQFFMILQTWLNIHGY